MLKKVTLLAIMLLVTNIHAVQVVQIINSSHRFIKIFYDVLNPHKYILIFPYENKYFSFDLPINTEIQVMYKDKVQEGIYTAVDVLSNIDDLQFVCKSYIQLQKSDGVEEVRAFEYMINLSNFDGILSIGDNGKIGLN